MVRELKKYTAEYVKSLSKEELKNIVDEYFVLREQSLDEYEARIKNIVEKYLENWSITGLFGTSSLCLFNKQYDSMQINIYFGYDILDEEIEKNFKFQINTSCFGSFDIIGDNECKEYYKAVGFILSNEDFQTLLKNTLFEFVQFDNDIKNNYQIVRNEWHQVKQQEETNNNIQKYKHLLADIKEYCKNNDTTNKYVVLAPVGHDYEIMCTYRKKQYKICEMPDNIERFWKNGYGDRKYGNFKIVNVDKIKFVD